MGGIKKWSSSGAHHDYTVLTQCYYWLVGYGYFGIRKQLSVLQDGLRYCKIFNIPRLLIIY
jgi:hypothetical protein